MKLLSSYIILFIFSFLSFRATSAPVDDEENIFPSDAVLQRINVEEDIVDSSTDILGDRLDLASGTLSFYQTDFSLPGANDMDIVVSRSWRGTVQRTDSSSLGDWTLEIPRIQTYAVKSSEKFSGSWGENAACSGFIEPSLFLVDGTYGRYVDPIEYFNGVNLIVPGKAHEKLITSTDSGIWKYRTKSNWRFSCYESANGREGFWAQSPDGKVYIFDVFTSRRSGVISDITPIPIYELYLYASVIRDRFGNEIKFNYDNGEISSIVASDGRLVSFSYNDYGVIDTVNSSKGTWKYEYITNGYGMPRLTTVTQPDGKSWRFDLDKLIVKGPDLYHYSESGFATCSPLDTTFTGTIEHPYGVKGTFTLAPTYHGRTDVPTYHRDIRGPDTNCFIAASIIKKQLTGPEITELEWSYNYSENKGGYDDLTSGEEPDGAHFRPGISEIDIKTTTVYSPSGKKIVHQFFRRWDATEGQEVRTEIYDKNSDRILRYIDNYFEIADCRGYTGILVENREPDICDVRNIKKVVTDFDENGDYSTYNTENLAFNDYDAPTLVKEYNSVNSSWTKYTAFEYMHHDAEDADYLLINIPTKTRLSNDNNNWVTISESEYYTATSDKPYLLKEKRYFGNWRERYVDYFNSGELKRIEYNALIDGDYNNYRWFAFGDYYRGQPQSFSMSAPDATGVLNAYQVVNNDGSIASTTDFEGVTTGYQYDEMGRLSILDNPDSWNDVHYNFLPVTSADVSEVGVVSGQYKRVITKGNYERTIFFDALLRPILEKRKDLDNGETYYQNRRFDDDGNLVFESYWSASPGESYGTSYTYDGLERIIRIYRNADNAITNIKYLSGNQKEVTNPRGHSVITAYHSYGKPETELPVSISAPEGVDTFVTYNIFGNITSVRQGDFTVNYHYDSSQNLCRISRQEFGDTIFFYSAGGELIWEARGVSTDGEGCQHDVVKESEKINYTYNNVGKVSQILYPDSTPDLTFSYDSNGRLQTLDTSDGVNWTYNYNNIGLLDAEMLQVDEKTFVVDYNYNANGNLSSTRYPSGNLVNYDPDAFGKPTRVGVYASDITYHPNGLLKSFTYGNGIQHVTTLNTAQLPVERSDFIQGAPIYQQTAIYDKTMNMISIIDGVDSYYNLSLSYDGLDRLDIASGSWGKVDINYDSVSNITSMVLGERRLDYSYDDRNLLISVTGFKDYEFSYDDRGNVISNGNHTFGYNLANQMVISGTNNYQYDGHNRRVKTITKDKTVYSYYNQNGKLLYKYNTDGSSYDFIYIGNRLIAKDSSGPSSFAPDDSPSLNVPSAATKSSIINISWDSIPEATFYLLQWKNSSGRWESVYNANDITAEIEVRGYGENKFRIAACNAAGCGAFSPIEAILAEPAMTLEISVPSDTDIDGSYTISWQDVETATYYILQEQKNGGAWTQVANQAGTSITLDNRANGNYIYRLKACNSTGCSGWKTSSSFTVLLPPNAPDSISVPNGTDTDGNYVISWSASDTATYYVLQEKKDSNSYSTIANQADVSATVSGRDNGVYQYAVKACNTSGCSSYIYSSYVNVLLPPAIPSLSGPSRDGDGAYTVSWNSVPTATTYTLQRKIGAASWENSYSGNSLNKSYSGEAEGTYYYRVRACNSSGCSAWSSSMAVIVAYPKITYFNIDPNVLVAPGSVTVSWQSENAAYCLVKQNGVKIDGNQSASGSKSLYFDDDGTVSVQCINGAKSHTQSGSVIVKYGNSGPGL